MMAKLYRPEHVRFVVTLTLQTLGLPMATGRLSWASELLHGVSRVVMRRSRRCAWNVACAATARSSVFSP